MTGNYEPDKDRTVLFYHTPVPPKRDDGFTAWIMTAANDAMAWGNRRTEMCVQPKPRFLPTWAWHRIVARVIVRIDGPE